MIDWKPFIINRGPFIHDLAWIELVTLSDTDSVGVGAANSIHTPGRMVYALACVASPTLEYVFILTDLNDKWTFGGREQPWRATVLGADIIFRGGSDQVEGLHNKYSYTGLTIADLKVLQIALRSKEE